MTVLGWLGLTDDRGGVLWGILCCWAAVLCNIVLLSAGVSIFYVVPFDIFALPVVVTLVMWLVQHWMR